jgi:hypothetical protein
MRERNPYYHFNKDMTMTTENTNDPAAPPERPLTAADHDRLVAGMQRHATRMAPTRPVAAAVGVVAGVLTRVTLQAGEQAAADPFGANGARKVDLLLRCCRELAKTVELQHKLEAPGDEEPSRQVHFRR